MITAEQLEDALVAGEIFDWRFTELTRAGYSDADALLLAREKEVDLRLAERLLVEGCPPSTALRILL
jgi:hypothetical protein